MRHRQPGAPRHRRPGRDGLRAARRHGAPAGAGRLARRARVQRRGAAGARRAAGRICARGLRWCSSAAPEDLDRVRAAYAQAGIAAELAAFFPDVADRLARGASGHRPRRRLHRGRTRGRRPARRSWCRCRARSTTTRRPTRARWSDARGASVIAAARLHRRRRCARAADAVAGCARHAGPRRAAARRVAADAPAGSPTRRPERDLARPRIGRSDPPCRPPGEQPWPP